MSRRFVSLSCPDGHGPLRDVEGALWCSAQDHDGRPKTHPLGPFPATRSWFTLADLAAVEAARETPDVTAQPGVGSQASRERSQRTALSPAPGASGNVAAVRGTAAATPSLWDR